MLHVMRRAALVLLIVLGCGLAAASLIAIWTRATVLNTDRYVNTMAPIAESPAVQDAVSERLGTRITESIDFVALAREALPDRADALAPAIAGGVESLVRSQLDSFVHSERFAELWSEANRRAHSRVVGLLTTGRSGRLELEGNTVYLDLSGAVDRVEQGLQDRGLTRVADAIPPSVDGRIVLLSSDGFARARDAIDRFERLTVVLPILALLLLAGHVLLSRPRRRGLLRVALGLAVTGLLLLAVVGIVRAAYLDAIDQEVLPREAAQDIFDALIGLLRSALRIAVVAALVLAALSLLVGRPLRAAATRVVEHPRTAWLAEHRSPVQWGVVFAGGLVLVAWDNPTVGVIVVDAVLIALALTLVAALAHSGRRVAS
jgi:hypothetical protein